MSYANAARHDRAKKYFNENMVVCMAKGIDYEKLAQCLMAAGYWRHVTGYQKVDFNRRFAIVFNNDEARDRLVCNGISYNDVHVSFSYHKKKDEFIKVFVSELPIGITTQEIHMAFAVFGELVSVNIVYKNLLLRRIDTGERVITFKAIDTNIPSYVQIRGWRAFVRYKGQKQTCRICNMEGHLAKDCPRNHRNHETQYNENPSEDQEPDQQDDQSEKPKDVKPDQSEDVRTEEEVVKPSEMEKNTDLVINEMYEKLFGSVGSICDEKVVVDGEFPVEEHEHFFDNSAVTNWGMAAEMMVKTASVFKSYCPLCRVDSHSEEECTAARIKSANKRKNSGSDSDNKPGKKGNFKRFKQDLAKVVIEGKITGEF